VVHLSVLLLMQMPPTSADHLINFHAELRAAYDSQMREHEISMAHFLERIASLCEGNGTNGAPPSPILLARAVRGLAHPTQQTIAQDLGQRVVDMRRLYNGGDVVAAKAPSNEDPPLRLMKQPVKCESEGCSVVSPDPVKPALRDVVPSVPVSPPPSLPVSPLEKKCFPSELERKLDTEEEADDREDAAQIEHEFALPRLTFIDSAGKICHSHSHTALDYLFGARVQKLKQCSALQAPCMQPSSGYFAQFVDSRGFKILSALMIMLNYYYIVHQTDYKMKHLGAEEPQWMFMIEVCFTAFYMWELACQVFVYRKDFFVGPEMVWNLFDSGIVFVSVFELVITLCGGKAINLSFLRVLRFLKISRVIRMFSALRLMKEIRIMVDALAGSFLIFVFCGIMLAMFFSIFAIFFVQGITTYLEDSTSVDEKLLASFQNDFGSVSNTMLSLFMSVTGGQDWVEFHSTVAAVGASYNFLFVFFIGFSSIAFLNVITGVFAEKALSLASPTNDELMVRRKEKEMRDAKELLSLLHQVLGSCISSLNTEAFEHLLSHPEVVKYLEIRGLKPCSARRFFTLLLEIHHTDTVDVSTFVSACIKLDGTASSIDLHVLSAELKSMQLKQNHLSHYLRQNIQGIPFHGEGQPAQYYPLSAPSISHTVGCSRRPTSKASDDMTVDGQGDVGDQEETNSTMVVSSDGTRSNSYEGQDYEGPSYDTLAPAQDAYILKPLSGPTGRSHAYID
jgi:hypothetical protein